MTRKSLLVLLSVTVATGLLAAGCGSSSTHTVTAPAPATTTSSSAGSTTASSSSPTTTSSSGGSSSSSSPAVAQAVAGCKASINAASQLSPSLKTKLTGICDKAANGDTAGVKNAVAQVCKQIVDASVPAGTPTSIKDQALAACKKA
jgi:hypothetical protein